MTPGADTSGFVRLLLTTSTGPRLEKPASASFESVAPTENEASYIAGASSIDEQLGPLFPADVTTSTPAALSASMAMRIGSLLATVSQPNSDAGQPQELLMTCGALLTSGLALARLVGARNH